MLGDPDPDTPHGFRAKGIPVSASSCIVVSIEFSVIGLGSFHIMENGSSSHSLHSRAMNPT